jgi:hypothetical protein
MRVLAVKPIRDMLMAVAGVLMLGVTFPAPAAGSDYDSGTGSNSFNKTTSTFWALAKSGGSQRCVEESTGQSGETILTLNSGRGCDWASTDGGASFSRVSASTPAHNYDTIPDTSWISGGSEAFASVIYSNAFELLCAFDEPSIEIQVHADNVATVYFNGVLLGQQPFIEHEINFQDPPELFSTSDPSLFWVGTNSIVIVVYNFNPPAGLDYRAQVTFKDLSVKSVHWEEVVTNPWDGPNLQPGNPHGGGLMFFAEKNSPTGPVHDKVVAVAKLGAPVPPGQSAVVYFKVFDMDDPTQDGQNNPPDPNIADPDDLFFLFKGDDNRDPSQPGGWGIGIKPTAKSSPNGMVSISAQPTDIIEVTVPEWQDEALVEYTLTAPQPGNNWKVVAHCQREFVEDVETDDQYPGFGLGFRRISDTQCKVPDEFQTELLSLWRSLHIEVDSMNAVPAEKPSPDRYIAQGRMWQLNTPTIGQSTLTLRGRLPVFPRLDTDFYSGGLISVFLTSPTSDNDIISSTACVLCLNDELVVDRSPPQNQDYYANTYFVVNDFSVWDDDDRYWPPSLLNSSSEILPKLDLITPVVSEKYAAAYIKLVDVEILGLNPNRIVPFDLYENPGSLFGTVADNEQDLADEPYFWVHTVTAGYQPSGLGYRNDVDLDPDTEVGRLGRAYPPRRVSVPYLETIRDTYKDGLTKAWGTVLFPRAEKFVRDEIDATVAHEIGHGPGGQAADADHKEQGLMGDQGQITDLFSPKTIHRFRKAVRWNE